MAKFSSKKIQEWTIKDKVVNTIVYVLNTVVLSLLFILAIYLYPGKENGEELLAFFRSIDKPITFFMSIIVTAVIIFFYFFIEDRDFLKRAANSEMIFLIIEVGIVLGYVFARFVNFYLTPFAIVPLIALFLTNKKHAIFTHAVFCVFMLMINIVCGTSTNAREYAYLLIAFAVGVIAIVTLGEKYSRLKLLSRSLILSIPSVLIVGTTALVGGIESVWQALVSAALSGPLSVSLFILLMPFFEGVFKKVSSFRLAELTDHGSKLIRRIIRNAPGTFNHAIVVSNLAEACATAIEEDATLARACAYYHDIGKLRRPEFFSENQADGINPHDDLTPELSTNIIRAHAQDGYHLALKHRLPKEIADVCVQHHGTLPILYFYDKAKKFTDGEVDINEYCYAGPKPQTKIAAIIMIADGCEAASRTLKDRSIENVRAVVTKIVNERMALGQFDECEITIKELNIIIHTIVNNLTGVYHHRVKYPTATLNGVKMDKPSDAIGKTVEATDEEDEGENKSAEIEKLIEEKPKQTEVKKPRTRKAKEEK